MEPVIYRLIVNCLNPRPRPENENMYFTKTLCYIQFIPPGGN